MEEVCRNGPADPRLLGHKFLDGRRQQQEKLRLEELQAEGLKVRKQKEAKAETAKKTEPKQSAGQLGPGWARVLRDAKVRASRAKDADVVGNVWEGNRVLIQEVASKAARIQEPVAGWVVLQKIAGPVLEQEPWQRQELGEPTATQQVTSMILQRLQLDATVETVPSNFGKECGSDSPSCKVRRAKPDFRSLSDYAWQRLHLAFPRASWNESGNTDPTEADEFVDAMSNYEGKEQEVFQDCEYAEEVAETEAQPAAGNATACGQFPCACPPSVFTCAAAADAETVVDAGQLGDFRSLPPDAWQHIHAKFTRVAAESSTDAEKLPCADGDFRSLPPDAWQHVHAKFTRVAAESFTDAEKLPCAAGDFRSLPPDAWQHIHAKFTRVAAESSTDAEKLPCAVGDFRSLPPESWQHIHAKFTRVAAESSTDAEKLPCAVGDFRSLPPDAWQHIHAKFTRVAAESSTDAEKLPCAVGDFRSLPPDAWQHIHAKFTRVAAESSTDAEKLPCADGDFRSLPPDAWQHIHAKFTRVAAESSTDAEKLPCADGDFRSLPPDAWQHIHAKFTRVAAESFTDAEKLPCAVGDFRSLPPESWQHIHAKFANAGNAGLDKRLVGDFRSLPPRAWQRLYEDFPPVARPSGFAATPTSATFGEWWAAFSKAMQETLCCGRVNSTR